MGGKLHRAFQGISTPQAIASSVCTSALAHPEDASIASYNIHLCGADKVRSDDDVSAMTGCRTRRACVFAWAGLRVFDVNVARTACQIIERFLNIRACQASWSNANDSPAAMSAACVAAVSRDQLWYIVPPAKQQQFVKALQRLMGKPEGLEGMSTAAALAASKVLLPLLPPDEVERLGVRRIVQRPGDIVLTSPVSIRAWHQ